MNDPWCIGWWELDPDTSDWRWMEFTLHEHGTITRGRVMFRKNAVEEQPGHEKNKPKGQP